MTANDESCLAPSRIGSLGLVSYCRLSAVVRVLSVSHEYVDADCTIFPKLSAVRSHAFFFCPHLFYFIYGVRKKHMYFIIWENTSEYDMPGTS